MVLRFLIRILANNEQLIQRLSESYAMRRTAQLVVRVMFHGKYFLQDTGLDKKLTPEQFREAMRIFSQKLQKQIKNAHEDIKKKMK